MIYIKIVYGVSAALLMFLGSTKAFGVLWFLSYYRAMDLLAAVLIGAIGAALLHQSLGDIEYKKRIRNIIVLAVIGIASGIYLLTGESNEYVVYISIALLASFLLYPFIIKNELRT